MAPRCCSRVHASCRATYAPQMDAVRVPPSACSTSQSRVSSCSPSASRSTTARSERPIRRWISWVRPPCLPLAASRVARSVVEPGSREYSAVTQPRPFPLSHPGTRSSSEAVHSTLVRPNDTRHEPSGSSVQSRAISTGRSPSASLS